MLKRRPYPSRRQRVFFGLGLSVALGLGALALRLSDAPGHASSSNGPPGLGLIARARPLAGGEPVAISDATRLLETPVFLPTTTSADATSATAWIRTGSDEYLLVEYISGLQVEVRPWSGPGTPEEHFRDLVRIDAIDGQVTTGGGFPMFVVPPGPDSGGSVDFVLNGTWVSVYGEGFFDRSSLVKVALSAANSQSL